jgi:hypothetical protein
MAAAFVSVSVRQRSCGRQPAIFPSFEGMGVFSLNFNKKKINANAELLFSR